MLGEAVPTREEVAAVAAHEFRVSIIVLRGCYVPDSLSTLGSKVPSERSDTYGGLWLLS